MTLSLAHMGHDGESVLCGTAFAEDGFERLGFL